MINAISVAQENTLYSLGCTDIRWVVDGRVWVTCPSGYRCLIDPCELIRQLADADLEGVPCSACAAPVGIEIWESAYLPESVFCSKDCRDAAEFAAESVR